MEAIFGTIVGFVAFGIIWFFLLKPKNNQASNDELKIKDEELKHAQIDLYSPTPSTIPSTFL